MQTHNKKTNRFLLIALCCASAAFVLSQEFLAAESTLQEHKKLSTLERKRRLEQAEAAARRLVTILKEKNEAEFLQLSSKEGVCMGVDWVMSHRELRERFKKKDRFYGMIFDTEVLQKHYSKENPPSPRQQLSFSEIFRRVENIEITVHFIKTWSGKGWIEYEDTVEVLFELPGSLEAYGLERARHPIAWFGYQGGQWKLTAFFTCG